MKFVWDLAKNKANIKKHGISFEEALLVFTDPDAIESYDDDHSADEDRFEVIGLIQPRFIVVNVIFSEIGATVRLISARKATKKEVKIYEQKKGI